jgi:hypothetical protein
MYSFIICPFQGVMGLWESKVIPSDFSFAYGCTSFMGYAKMQIKMHVRAFTVCSTIEPFGSIVEPNH